MTDEEIAERVKKEIAERLRKARIEAGFDSARGAAVRHGWNISTYGAHDSGENGIAPHKAEKYAAAYGVSPAWLLTGEGDQTANIGVITLVGNVGAGGHICAPPQDYKQFMVVEVRLAVNIPEGRWSYKIEGSEHYPRYRNGMLLITGGMDKNPGPHVGDDAVVFLKDGRVLVRTLRESGEFGRYDLEHFREPPIYNVEVTGVCPILAIIPAGRWEGEERDATKQEVLDRPRIPKAASR